MERTEQRAFQAEESGEPKALKQARTKEQKTGHYGTVGKGPLP